MKVDLGLLAVKLIPNGDRRNIRTSQSSSLSRVRRVDGGARRVIFSKQFCFCFAVVRNWELNVAALAVHTHVYIYIYEPYINVIMHLTIPEHNIIIKLPVAAISCVR